MYCIFFYFPGEYIDVQFDQKKPSKNQSPKQTRSGSGSWQRKVSEPAVSPMSSSTGPGNMSAPMLREHDYEEVGDDEHYALMSPSDSKDRAPKLSSSLHKITCPLSLDDASMDTLQPKATSVSELMSSLSVDSETASKTSNGTSSTQSQIQTTSPTVVPPFSHSSPVSPASTCTSGSTIVTSDDSDYFNLDLSNVRNSGTANKKPTKESASPSKVTGGSKQKAGSKIDHSSASGSSSRKHSSSPLASLLQGLSQGRKSPKHKSSSSPKHSVSDEAAAYSEMSFLPPSSSPKVNRRRSESSNPPSQFTKNPPHSITTVKPNAVHKSATSESDSMTHKSMAQDSASSTAAMRSIKSTGSLTALEVSSSHASKIHVTSPKILLTSTELINEISATSSADTKPNRRSGSWQENNSQSRLSQDLSYSEYENMSFENNKPSRQTSHTSVGSGASGEPELHYAALDLSASVEDIMPATGSEHSSHQKSPGNKSRHTSGSVVPNSTNGNGGIVPGCIDEETPLQYAQIDFVKSESLRTNLSQHPGGNTVSTNVGITQKETQIPFEVANMNLQTTWKPSSANDNPTAKKTQAPFDLG